jgi:hypothetical protein
VSNYYIHSSPGHNAALYSLRMKQALYILTAVLLLAAFAVAGPIDGKWYAERTMERDGEKFTIKQTFDLKSEGATLTGTLTMAFGDMEPRSIPIKEGKIDGNNFSFLTVMETPNGEFKSVYKGTIEGNVLKGTSEREGSGQTRPFEAKKQ